MLPIWTSEFLQAVSRMDPKFIALHLQEVGGKTYEKSMQYVKDFVQRLCDCPELRLYDKIRIFLDEDFSSPEKFTVSIIKSQPFIWLQKKKITYNVVYSHLSYYI